MSMPPRKKVRGEDVFIRAMPSKEPPMSILPAKAERPACYKNHPPMPLPGSDKVVYGGSCINPVIHDADVYIGFDKFMHRTKRAWPWEEGEEVLFSIPDRFAPSSPRAYQKLVLWTRERIDEGKVVHAGCVGGHGRTGMFLAALAAAYGEKDAIAYVRLHYCPKAVESRAQVKFLVDHFGCAEAEHRPLPAIVKPSGDHMAWLEPAEEPGDTL